MDHRELDKRVFYVAHKGCTAVEAPLGVHVVVEAICVWTVGRTHSQHIRRMSILSVRADSSVVIVISNTSQRVICLSTL